MNKEQFRKELEDCWELAGKRSIHINEDGNSPLPDRKTYINTRLAALDDGDDKDFHFEKNYSYSDMMRLAMAMAGWCSEIRLRDAIHGTDAHNYASKFIKDKFPRSALFETELAKFPETDFNKKDLVDDGQEGKGLKFIEWEYKVRPSLVDWDLTDMGKQGWQLCAVNDKYYYFKRPLPEPPKP